MIDKEDSVAITRIAGIATSLLSALVMFLKPFEPVTNTLTVYFLLIAAALCMIISQIVTIRANLPGEFSNNEKRQEAVYDVVTICLVMVLFIIFYVVPYILKYTSWLS